VWAEGNSFAERKKSAHTLNFDAKKNKNAHSFNAQNILCIKTMCIKNLFWNFFFVRITYFNTPWTMYLQNRIKQELEKVWTK